MVFGQTGLGVLMAMMGIRVVVRATLMNINQALIRAQTQESFSRYH